MEKKLWEQVERLEHSKDVIDCIQKFLDEPPLLADCSLDSVQVNELTYLNSLLKLKTLKELSNHSQNTGNSNGINISSFLNQKVSRYENDFEEIKRIGSGAFGEVYEVKSRMDKCHYAVKKIPLAQLDNEEYKKAKMEVEIIASLKHENIVRYFCAWFEPFYSRLKNKENEEKIDKLSDESYSTIEFSEFSGKLDQVASEESRCLVSNRTIDYDSFSDSSDKSLKNMGILYIQMELCTATLCDYIDERNHNNSKIDISFNYSVLKQTAEALTFIHSRNIIHRDIKPKNVFLNNREDIVAPFVRVGDFGLSRRIGCGLKTIGQDDYSMLSIGVGTHVYAAPEQLHASDYNSSVDIFSLGIIMYELFSKFGTNMERCLAIENLRNGQISDEIEKYFPREVDLIRSLSNLNSKLRPSAKEIVEIFDQMQMENRIDSQKEASIR